MEKTRSDPRLSWKELTSFVCAILLTCLDKSICIQHPVRSLNSHAFSTPHMTIHTHTHAHTHTHTHTHPSPIKEYAVIYTELLHKCNSMHVCGALDL